MENCIICNGKIKDAGIQRRLLGEKERSFVFIVPH